MLVLHEEPPKQQTQTVATTTVPHTISRTSGDGVWLHESPGLNTPLHMVMPEGSQFNVDCFVPGGDIVNGNAVWLEGDYNGTHGAVTDYYIDTHWNTTQDLVTQGIEQCGTQPAAAPAPAPVEQPQSVFYSPLSLPTGLRGLSEVADINKPHSGWSTGDCKPHKAAEDIPDSVRTLAGWSVGRMGPIYFLASSSEEEKSKVKNIVLLDPGDSSSFAARKVLGIPVNERCDDDYNVNYLLSNWLSRPDTNLTILTGRTTEEKEDNDNPESKSTFAGLWKHYLADIWEKPFADRAKICDYNYMDHEEIMRKFAAKAIAEPTVCPEAPNNIRLTEWHP